MKRHQILGSIACLGVFLCSCILAFGQDRVDRGRSAEVDQQIDQALREVEEANQRALERRRAEALSPPGPVVIGPPAPAPSMLYPPPIKVKVTIGGYRLTRYTNSGDNGSIAREGGSLEVEGAVDLGHVLTSADRKSDEYSRDMARDVCKLFDKPFIVERPVPVPCPCPTPVVNDCRGLGVARSCCGPTVVAAPCGHCRGVGCTSCRGARYVPSCNYCRGAGCSNCRGYRPAVGFGFAGAPADVMQRGFWCNCASHRSMVLRVHGNTPWQQVPCMCPEGCATCGGAGHCGRTHAH